MLSLLLWLLVAFRTSIAKAQTRESSSIHHRNASSPFNGIDVTVLSPNGTDVTSSFQTRVYYRSNMSVPHPKFAALNTSAPTEFADLNPRGTLTYTYLGRPIGGNGVCKSRTASFQHSVCRRSLGIQATMQDFVVFCQESDETYAAQNPRWTPQPSTANRGGHASTSYSEHIPPVLAEDGECYADEICIDGVFRDRGYPALASCVTEDDYDEDPDEDITEELGGASARITVTNVGSRMPVKMRNMQIQASTRPGGLSGGASSSRSNHEACGDCSDLRAGPLADDVNSLKVEASLMTAGAVAGVLLIAIASG